MSNKNNTAFVKQFTRSTRERKQAIAERTANEVLIHAKRTLDEYSLAVSRLEAEIEKTLDITGSGVQTVNIIKKDFDGSSFFSEVTDLKIQLKEAKDNYEIAKTTFEELFGVQEEDIEEESK